VNPGELWDEAARRQRVLARRHEQLAGLSPATPAYGHQAERVCAAADELLAVLDEIESAARQRRLTRAVALVAIALALAVIAAVGALPTVMWCTAAVAAMALLMRWQTA
jgi:Flp pilus assembly protein TadB